jgi:hypothetical protein
MPANLTPEFKAAEAAFRQARDPRERLECLREMLRTIPKHKGADHLQGDIKSRISVRGCFANSASCGFTPKRRANRRIWSDRSPCAADKPCATWPG